MICVLNKINREVKKTTVDVGTRSNKEEKDEVLSISYVNSMWGTLKTSTISLHFVFCYDCIIILCNALLLLTSQCDLISHLTTLILAPLFV